MNHSSDQQLLRDYAQQSSDAAFAELVRRHVDLVYSAAFRLVGEAHSAKDVTQAVFLALAQNARRLAGHPVLSGWLHCTARNLAAKTVRTTVRRQAREKEAVAMNELLAAETNPPWEHITPHLDDALGDLQEADRDALLLRYFERKSAREMALVLGTSEDAAQKRVTRAIERLRELFAKRGIAAGTSGLATVISVNAVQAAPAGLAAAISTTTLLVGTTAAQAIAMTTLQKTLITGIVAALAGTGIYEARQAAHWHDQAQALQQQQSQLAGQIDQLQRERDHTTHTITTPVEVEAKEISPDHSNELLRLRGEVSRLHRQAEENKGELEQARKFQNDIAEVFSNTPPVQTLLAITDVSIPWGETMLSGGWKTPSGKRVVVLTSLQAEPDGKQVTVKSYCLEYTAEAGEALGLDQFNTDGQIAGNAHKLDAEQVAKLLKAAQDRDGVNIISVPSVRASSGRQSQVEVADMMQTPSGEKYNLGPLLDFRPTIASDGQSVRLMMTARLNYLISPQIPRRLLSETARAK